MQAFLRCGDLHAGFTHLHCPECGHDFLLAFTCKQRGLCPSCHQRRTLDEAAFIADTVCQPVPHRHLVFTVPRLIRTIFREHRGLLGELAHAAHEALTVWLRERTGCAAGQPGLVVAVQTFGDYLFWHPHVHVIATAGVFAPDGTFQLVPPGGWNELKELWRHAVLRRLQAAKGLADWQVERLRTWRHGGFTLDAGPAPIAADDAAGRRRLAEYLLRAPFSLEKIVYNAASGHVLYRSERHWRTRRNFEAFRAHDFIAALIAQLPPKGVPLVRYYGWYSNKARGQRARRQAPPLRLVGATPGRKRRRTRWRELIVRVWGVDPLRCPLCTGLLRRVAVVETADTIRAALEPLGLYDPQARPTAQGPPGCGPPALEVDVVVEVDTGTAYPVEEPWTVGRFAWPRPRQEPLYHRRWALEPGEDFDQTGFELPPLPAEQSDGDQTQLFDDAVQADAPDGEPVFWRDTESQADASDDFVQHDAPDDCPASIVA